MKMSNGSPALPLVGGAVKGQGCIVVEQDPQAKFEVERCSKEDIGETTGFAQAQPKRNSLERASAPG
jgi:hypothetical protein